MQTLAVWVHQHDHHTGEREDRNDKESRKDEGMVERRFRIDLVAVPMSDLNASAHHADWCGVAV